MTALWRSPPDNRAMSLSARCEIPVNSIAFSIRSRFFFEREGNNSIRETVPMEISSLTVIRIFVGMLAAVWETHPTSPRKLVG